MAEELKEIRNDLKKIVEKIDEKFDKMDAWLTELRTDFEKEMESMRVSMKGTSRTTKIGQEGEQQQEFGDGRERERVDIKETLDLNLGWSPGDTKRSSGPDERGGKTKIRKMAVKEWGREGSMRKYLLKNTNSLKDGFFNTQNEVKDYKLGKEQEEQDIRWGKRIDQKKRRRNEGVDRENEKGEHKGGDFLKKKKRDEG